jgi:hypothetical protein
MSVDHVGYLVVGVALNEILEYKTIKSEVTRYDTKTGKPYKAFDTENKHYFFGKELDEEPDDLEYWIEDKLDLDLVSLGSDFVDPYEGYVVGKEMCEADNCEANSADINELVKVRNEIQIQLEKYGFKGSVEVWLVHYCG